MREICIRFINDSHHRKDDQGLSYGPGDWWFDENGDLQIRVTNLGDDRYNFLLARHEMDEAFLCKHNGITTKMVDDDDSLLSSIHDDPDSFSGYPGCIFQVQHNDALAGEWQMSRLLNVDWKTYGKAFEPFWISRQPKKERKK